MNIAWNLRPLAHLLRASISGKYSGYKSQRIKQTEMHMGQVMLSGIVENVHKL